MAANHYARSFARWNHNGLPKPKIIDSVPYTNALPSNALFSEDKLKSKAIHWSSSRNCNYSGAWYSQHLLP